MSGVANKEGGWSRVSDAEEGLICNTCNDQACVHIDVRRGLWSDQGFKAVCLVV